MTGYLLLTCAEASFALKGWFAKMRAIKHVRLECDGSTAAAGSRMPGTYKQSASRRMSSMDISQHERTVEPQVMLAIAFVVDVVTA